MPEKEGLYLTTQPLLILAPRPGLEPGTYGLTVSGDGISGDLLKQLASGILSTDQQLTSIFILGRLGPFAPKLAPDWHHISYGLWKEIKFPRLLQP